MDVANVLTLLKQQANPENAAGMARFGINPNNTLGVNIPTLRELAKEVGKNHKLALELWDTEIHEARLLAGFIGDPEQLTEAQMESWVKDFDSWDVCDQVCSNLFDKTSFAWKNAREWPLREEEFVRRAGFVMMACLAVHDKKASDEQFKELFPLIIKYSTDQRNFVKKAVNWALRGVGKRNLALNKEAVRAAKEISILDSKAARWIASDALRELQSEAVQARLSKKA